MSSINTSSQDDKMTFANLNLSTVRTGFSISSWQTVSYSSEQIYSDRQRSVDLTSARGGKEKIRKKSESEGKKRSVRLFFSMTMSNEKRLMNNFFFNTQKLSVLLLLFSFFFFSSPLFGSSSILLLLIILFISRRVARAHRRTHLV